MFQNLSCIREDLPSLDFPSVSKQALSKARQFINPSLFKELFYLSADLFYSQLPSRRLWHGYHLFAVDGSKIELPNSSSNFEFFGEMFGYPDPSRRFTMGLASIVYDVLDDYIVHTFLPGNSKDGTTDIDVRVIEVTLDDVTKEYLATNLFYPLITQTMFQELYFYRWPVMQISAYGALKFLSAISNMRPGFCTFIQNSRNF